MPPIAANKINTRTRTVPSILASPRGAVALAAGIVFAYLHLFLWPAVPRFIWGDQDLLLLNGMRLAAGQVMYRDFFFFTLPSADLFYAILIKLFGARAWIPNATMLLLGMGLAWVAIRISATMMPGATALLPALLFLCTGYRSFLDATHHWFSVFFVMAATAVLIEDRSVRRMALAGALLGVASCFTQTRGPCGIAAVSVFVLWEWFEGKRGWRDLVRGELAMAGAFVAVLAGFCSYFAYKAGLGTFLWDNFVFPQKYYLTDLPWNSWAVYLSGAPPWWPWYRLVTFGIWIFIFALIPGVYVVFFAAFWRYRKRQAERAWEPAMLVALVGLLLFATVSYGPGFDRLCEISLPAIIILVFLLSRPGKAVTIVRRGLWAATLAMLVALPVRVQTRWHRILDLPSGKVAFFEPDAYAKYSWLSRQTRPGDVFFQAGFTDTYFMLHLNNPTAMHYLTPNPYTRPWQVKGVVERLRRSEVRWILWRPTILGQVDGSGHHDNLQPLRQLMLTDYRDVKDFPDGDQMWERIGATSGVTHEAFKTGGDSRSASESPPSSANRTPVGGEKRGSEADQGEL